MAWIELHQTRAKHPKTLRLAALLKKDRRYVCGLLDDLWSWGLDAAAKDGALTGLSASDIAVALDFPENKGKWLVGALVEAGYVDKIGVTYYLHDWMDYSARINEKRAANAERMRRARTPCDSCTDRAQDAHTERTDCAQEAHTQRTNGAQKTHCAGATVPNRTLPGETIENQVTPPVAPQGGGAGKAVPSAPSLAERRFDEFWAAYPRKVGKAAARKAFAKAGPDSDLQARILDAIARQKGGAQWRKDNGQYIPNPATWLNQGRWDDEVTPAQVRVGPAPPRAAATKAEQFRELAAKYAREEAEGEEE